MHARPIVSIALTAAGLLLVAGCSTPTLISSGTGGGAATPAPAAPTVVVGTRDNPAALGSTLSGTDFDVVVNSVTLAATDAVIAENQFNEAPAAGNEYILVNYSATYTGTDPDGESAAFVSVEYVTPEGNTINSYDTFVVPPLQIDTLSTLYTGATATGNVVFSVPSATAGDGVLAVTPGILGDKVFVAVK